MNNFPKELLNTSISHGTMRHQDLIPAFLNVIKELDLYDDDIEMNIFLYNIWCLLNNDKINILQAKVALQNTGINFDDFNDETPNCILEYMFDILDTIAPENYYFGSHPGDGSDYGFWECEE